MLDGRTVFVDRNMGARVVPEALRRAGWNVVTMDERYGVVESQSVPDTQWIEEAARNGDLLLCKDRRITTRPLEVEAIVRASAQVLVMASGSATAADMIDDLLSSESRIDALASRREGPWVYAVRRDGIRPMRLRV